MIWIALILLAATVFLLWEIHRKLHEVHLGMAQLGNCVKLIMLKQGEDEIGQDELARRRKIVLAQIAQVGMWQSKLGRSEFTGDAVVDVL